MNSQQENLLIKMVRANPNRWFRLTAGTEVREVDNPKNIKVKHILTKRQYEILNIAVSNGYYEYPQKITLCQLSEELELSPSTLCAHLKKIRAVIFRELINKNLI